MTILSGVRRGMRRRDARHDRRRSGFSLIEIVVAMTLLSIVLMSLAKLSTNVGVLGRMNAVAAKRNAALQLEANKLGATPYSNIATWSTATKTDTLNGFIYTRRLTITAASGSRYTVKIVVVPKTDTTKKDSVVFDRSLPSTGSPLCVGC